MPKLVDILGSEVKTEIEGILAEADKKAAEIISEAESRASTIVAGHKKNIEAKLRGAIHQARSAADLTVSSARIKAKGEVMDLLRQKVLNALDEATTRPNYSEVLEALAREALEISEGAETIIVHPDDKEKLNGWAQQNGLELQTDKGIRLGVRILSTSGSAVENTLPGRLQRVWNTLEPEVNKLLWSEAES